MRKYAKTIIAVALVGVFAFVYMRTREREPNSPTQEQIAAIPTPPHPTTPLYSVLNIKDVSSWTAEKDSQPARKSLQVSISTPYAKSFEERGQMVVAACKSILAERGAQAVQVWL